MANGGPEIRVYVITNAEGEVLAVKLNRTSATALQRITPGSAVEPHMADKRMPPTEA